MKRTIQHGFTMIELIVVIVILGILASVALPRFTNMQRDARIAKLNAARGAVAAAAAMVHGAALSRQGVAQPVCPADNVRPAVNAAGAGSVCTEFGRVNVVNLYPTAQAGTGDPSGIVFASGLVAPGATLASEGYAAAGGGGGAGAMLTIQVTGGTAAVNCSFTYTSAVAGGSANVSAVNTAGC